MPNPYKPKEYNSVSPYLMVSNAQRLIDMLEAIFDAREMRKYTRADGSVMHAEVQLDDSIIMLAEATDKYPAYRIWMHIYVADVDAVFHKALLCGCEAVEQPTEKPGDPDRRGTFKDFAGNMWSVATQKINNNTSRP
jgi:uncharacterized glyoxalase superfamily protein PhnB